MYSFNTAKSKFKEIEEWLGREYMSLRSGQATPAILDNIHIDSYGQKTSLKHIASISIEDARTLRISPWDVSQLKQIEKAIITSDLGLSARPDDTSVRVSFPDLTTERRQGIIKVAKEKLEESRVSVRREREKVLKDVSSKEEDGEIGEDESKRLKVELQKIVDATNKTLDALLERKEIEISK